MIRFHKLFSYGFVALSVLHLMLYVVYFGMAGTLGENIIFGAIPYEYDALWMFHNDSELQSKYKDLTEHQDRFQALWPAVVLPVQHHDRCHCGQWISRRRNEERTTGSLVSNYERSLEAHCHLI